MTEIVKMNQPPPPSGFAERLRAMRDSGDPALGPVLRLAKQNGWTYQVLADAIGVSRQAVEQRILRSDDSAIGVDVPLPPRKPTPARKVKPRLTLRQELIDELREMQAVASKVNGGMAADHPDRRVSEHFTKQLAAYVDQGVTVYYLAKALGVSHNAIQFRLARHGYRKPSPSQIGKPSHTYVNRKIGDPPFGRKQSECHQGHPLSGDNLGITPGGKRWCRSCQRRRDQEKRRRKTAA